MALYPATTDLADLTATNPTGAEDANKIDDALRETRAVLKAVVTKAHSTKGEHPVAIWRDKTASGAPYGPSTPVANVWTDHLGWTRVADPYSLDQSTNPVQFKPKAGTYEIEAWASAYNCNRHQIRIADVSAGNVGVAGLYGNVAFSNRDNTDGSETISRLDGIITTDGNKVYKLQHIWQTNPTTNNVFGVGTAGLTGGWSESEHCYGAIKLRRIG